MSSGGMDMQRAYTTRLGIASGEQDGQQDAAHGRSGLLRSARNDEKKRVGIEPERIQKPAFVIARSAATKQSRAMQRDFQPAVYIMASARNGTLYVGVTSDLVQRAWQHREGLGEGFTKRYGCKLLVWYELHATMYHAIAREKQIKGGSRKRKLVLIEAFNPQWRDLFNGVCH